MNRNKLPPGQHNWSNEIAFSYHTCDVCNIISMLSPYTFNWEWMFIDEHKWRKNLPKSCKEAQMIQALE